MKDRQHILHYFEELASILPKLDLEAIGQFLDWLRQARHEEKTIFLVGNGGSAATAAHLVCDWGKGIVHSQEKGMRVVALADNLPSLMAYANDLSYEEIFVEPLKRFLRPGDLVVALSGSGNSPNVLRAVEWANANGGLTIGFTGYSGGHLRSLVQLSIHVPVDDMQKTEDIHLILGHLAMQCLSERRPQPSPAQGQALGCV